MRREAAMASRYGHRRVASLVVTVAVLGLIAVACAAEGQTGAGIGAGGTEATVTAPTATGPAERRPSSEPSADFVWLPPKGAEPSTPPEGKLVLSDGGVGPSWWSVHVYADGRVIWWWSGRTAPGWLERRLTPEGVELLRSGAVGLGSPPEWALPASAWADAEAKPYIPSRYVVCATWSRQTMRLLPQQTQDLLRGNTDEQAVIDGEVTYLWAERGAACPAVTIEEARALDRTFLEVGFERSETAGGLVYDMRDHVSSIGVIPLLPDGAFEQCCPG